MSDLSLLSGVLLAAICGLIGLHALYLRARRRLLFLDPLNMFWGGVLVCYVLQPLQFGDVFAAWHPPGLMEESLAWILFGLFFVVVGYEVRLGQRWGWRAPALPTRLNPRRVMIASAVFMGIGVGGYGLMIASAGGLEAWASVGRGGTDWEKVSGYVAVVAQLLPLGVTLSLFHVEMHRVAWPKRLCVWALGSLMWLWLVYEGTRSRTIVFTVTALAAFFLPRRKNPPAWLLGGGFASLLLLTNFQATYRDRFTALSFNLQEVDADEAYERVLPMPGRAGDRRSARAMRAAEFNCVMTVVELVPNEVPYNYGYGHLEIFTRPIPRMLWPDKVYPAAEAVFLLFSKGGLSTTWIPTSKEPLLMGPALTFIGHWYSVGGPWALMFAGFVTGVLFRTIRALRDRAPDSEAGLLVFTSLLPIGFSDAAATPMAWIFTIPFVAGPLLLVIRWSRVPLARRGQIPASGHGSKGTRRPLGPPRRLSARP